MNIKKMALVIIVTVWGSFDVNAVIAKRYCISTIEQALSIALEMKIREHPQKPAVIWDIDDTLISTVFNSHRQKITSYLREYKLTDRVVRGFQNNDFKNLIITARLHGKKLFPEESKTSFILDSTISLLLELTSFDFLEFGLINLGGVRQRKLGDNYIIECESIIFAGQHEGRPVKADAAALILDDDNLIAEKVTHLIVIDDNFNQINRYDDVFQAPQRSEKVYLMHYPFREACREGYEIVE